MGAITLTLSGCLLLETVSAECALTNQMQGVDGALTLTTMVRQFVMEGTKRCARGQELGFLLRDTSLWGRQLFVGRWFDTILRSMVKAKVSQKSGRFGGEDTNDYFKYVLWETSLSNIT